MSSGTGYSRGFGPKTVRETRVESDAGGTYGLCDLRKSMRVGDYREWKCRFQGTRTMWTG